MENVFKGTGPAVITPFCSKDLSIDYTSLGKIIEMQIENGIDFLVALGTTAETATMSHEERHQVYRFIREVNNGRLPFMVGFGGNNTAEVISHIQSADFSGIDAILSVVPYYNKPTQEGLFRHFMAIADASPVPIVLYNVPSRCGVNMSAETTLRLAKNSSKFVAVKEASGNIEQIKEIINNAPEGFGVISGDDSMIHAINTSGGCGVISVMANAYPKLISCLTNHCIESQPDSLQTQQSLAEFIRLLFVEGNPAGVKAVLHQRGLIENVLRLPLCPVSEDTYNLISEELKKLPNAC